MTMNIFIGDCKNIDGNRKTARSTIHGVIAWNFLLEEGGGGSPFPLSPCYQQSADLWGVN